MQSDALIGQQRECIRMLHAVIKHDLQMLNDQYVYEYQTRAFIIREAYIRAGKVQKGLIW